MKSEIFKNWSEKEKCFICLMFERQEGGSRISELVNIECINEVFGIDRKKFIERHSESFTMLLMLHFEIFFCNISFS
jgi:hypothetical protein